MEMCRACLSTGINMIPMDESTIENYNHITNLNIMLSDHISLYICKECHSAMMFCKKFRDKCIASDHTLNEILFLNNTIEPESNQEDNDYYVVIKKNSEKEEMKDDSEEEDIGNDDAFKGIETIIIGPSTNVVTDDEEIDNPLLDSEIYCGLCPLKFIDKEMFIDHLVTHSEDNNCQICHVMPSNNKSEWLAHRMQHVPDKQKGCLFCDKAYLSTASLQFHYMTVHKLDDCTRDIRQEYLENTIKFVIKTSPVREDTSKEMKTAINRQPRIKKNLDQLNAIKRKGKRLVVDANTIILSENELKKLLEKTKEGFVPYYCGACPEELEDKRQLIKHLEFHKKETHCILCGLELTSYPHLLAHRLAHVPNNQSSCLFCPTKYFNENELEQHYMNMHKLTEEVLPYLCKTCHWSYETEKQLILHMKYKHTAIKYICDYCSKGIKSALVSHIISHQDCRRYKCDLCDYRAKLPGGIKEHVLRRHTASRVYCSECRRAFPTEETLERHRPCAAATALHTMCPICGLKLKITSNLSRHLRTHTGVYQYQCGLCPAQYKSKSSFDSHLNKHTGTRKYRCEYCPMKFYSQPVLIKHRRIHTGERPYACKLCDRRFTGNNNLKVHMRVHGFRLIKKKKK